MEECQSDVKPSFGGSLSDLLIKINSALMDSMLSQRPPSTVRRQVLVRDITDPSDKCLDPVMCPIRTFRQRGSMQFTIDVNHPDFAGFSVYRVSEMRFEFLGADPNLTTGNSNIKILIESVGHFYGRNLDTIYEFVSTALSLTYEYDIVTGITC